VKCCTYGSETDHHARNQAANSGRREVVYDYCGHSPHIEYPAEVAAELLRLV